MKRLPLVALVLLLACPAALADENKPFIQLARGNFWKYDVLELGEKKSGKIEVTEIGMNGKFEMKFTGMGVPEEAMAWKVGNKYLVWEFPPETKWKILKFGVKKGDSWSSEIDFVVPIPVESEVVAVEDIQTPAGRFKGCLKIRNVLGTETGSNIFYMWWARGVGLVKLETVENGELDTRWTLTGYKVGYDISDEKLKEMVEEADVVALVAVPREAAGARKAQVKLADLYKGDLEAKDGEIIISHPEEGEAAGKLKQGDFIVFLKKEGGSLVMRHGARGADKIMLDRLGELLTPPEYSAENLKELCKRAEIVAGVEIVVLEDRQTFKYYVAKIIVKAKGARRRKYLDVLSVPGMNLEKGKRYVLMLEKTKKSGRKLLQPVDAAAGVLEYDQGLLNKLGELCEDLDNGSRGE